jgi:hypothetical protein
VSTIIGATKLDQLEDNLEALEFEIPADLSHQLEEAGRPELVFPYFFYAPALQAMVHGGTRVESEPPWYRGR